MSQNSALPSTTPAESSLTNCPRFCGRGTSTLASGASARGRSAGGPGVPPPAPGRRQTPSQSNAPASATPIAVALSATHAKRPTGRPNIRLLLRRHPTGRLVLEPARDRGKTLGPKATTTREASENAPARQGYPGTQTT